MFKIIELPSRVIDKRKVRLVIEGYLQTHGIYCNETFNLVVKYSTIKVVLSLIVHFRWGSRPIEINNTFLNGDLEDMVLMR